MSRVALTLAQLAAVPLIACGCRKPTSCADDQYIASERDLDALSQCDVVGGRLEVDGQVWLTSLDLPLLESVAAMLKVTGCDALVDVAMPGLVVVDGAVRIRSNPALAAIDDLGSLESVGEEIFIHRNESLERIGLPALAAVGRDLVVRNNDALVELDLPVLSTVSGDVDIDGQAVLDALELPGLSAVGGNLWVARNASLAHIDLPSLETLGRSLYIHRNDALAGLDMRSLRSLERSLTIRDSASLTSVALPALVHVGDDLTIQDNAALTTIDLPRLDAVGDDLTIQDNLAVTRIDLSGLTDAGDRLYVMHQPALTELDLSGLEEVYFAFFNDNDALAVLELPVLEFVDELTVWSAEALHGLTAPKISSLRFLNIVDNRSITTIEMSSLADIRSSLLIQNNDSLVGLEGLSGVTAVGFQLTISGNDDLSSLNGLSCLRTVSHNLTITDNASLCQVDAQVFVDGLEVGGDVLVFGNGADRTDCGAASSR